MESDHSAPLLTTSEPDPTEEIARRTTQKLDYRVASICVLLGVIAYMDRSNITYAAQNLCEYLGIDHKEYGTAISLFYTSYPITNLTGNLIMRKMGGSTRFALLCVIWGSVATLTAFIQSKAHFYAARIMLGIAEGALFPTIFYYLSLFYPEKYIANVLTLLIGGSMLMSPISAAIAAGLLRLDGVFGIAGWRLLFFAEGLIPILFAPFVFFLLPNTPDDASFLNFDEKKWILDERTKFYGQHVERPVKEQIKIVFSHFYMWIGTVSDFLAFGVSAIIGGWFILIIEDVLSLENIDTGTCASATDESVEASLLNVVNSLFVAFCCLSLRFVRINNRPMTICAGFVVGGILLFIFIFAKQLSPVMGFIFINLSMASMTWTPPLLVSLKLSYFDHSSKAVASSVINTFSTLGGAVLPIIGGIILDSYGYNVTIAFSACVLFLAGIVAVFMKETLKIQTTNRHDDVNEESTSRTENTVLIKTL